MKEQPRPFFCQLVNKDRLQNHLLFCFQNTQSFKGFWKQFRLSYFVTIPKRHLQPVGAITMLTLCRGLHLTAMAAFINEIPQFSLGLSTLAAGPVFFRGHQLIAIGAPDRNPSENKEKKTG